MLVCLDGSKASEACLPMAESIANAIGGDVTLLRVTNGDGHRSDAMPDPLESELTKQEGLAYLDGIRKIVSQRLGGRGVETRLESGRPAERIVEVARQLATDLIVMASRGAGDVGDGVESLTLGATAQGVLGLAHASILIVHDMSRAPATLPRILVPLDGSPWSESVLPIAIRIARFRDAELLLVHVVREPLPTALLPSAEDMSLAADLARRSEAGANQYLDRLRRQHASDLPRMRALVVRHASEHHGLLEVAEREKAELIVLSAHGADYAASRSLGSVTAFLLTHARTPLLTFQGMLERDRAGAHVAPSSSRTNHSEYSE
jgi:nucleotide-binding universal stress UspA family protein